MEPSQLKRQLGLFDSVMLISGDVIGVGIFVTTGFIAASLPSPGGVLLVWVLGGLLAMAGALSCAELSASLPYAGGDYIYIREAYGKLVGFLSGWSSFLVTFSGSVAAIAVALASFVSSLFPSLGLDRLLVSTAVGGYAIQVSVGTVFSIAAVVTISAIHYLGVRQGVWVQNILTALKISALLGIIVLGALVGKGSMDHFVPFFKGSTVGDLSAFGGAFIPVIFAYAGWNAVIYLAGEVKRPEKNLPRALVWANSLVIVLYLAINAIYIYAVPVTEMKGELRVSEVATTALFGHQTSAWITAIIAVSVLGALNAVIMIGPRIYYAMARDGVFFGALARVHPRFNTPSNAIVLQAVWSCALLLTGTFDALFTYVSVIISVFSALTVGAVIVLRFKRPDLQRPYRVWGYPAVPIAFVLVSLWIAWGSLVSKPWQSLGGVVIVAVGIPAYFFWQSRLKRTPKGVPARIS